MIAKQKILFLLITTICIGAISFCTHSMKVENKSCTPVLLPKDSMLMILGADSYKINAGINLVDTANFSDKSIDFGSSEHLNKLLPKFQTYLDFYNIEIPSNNLKALVLFDRGNLNKQIQVNENLLAVGVLIQNKGLITQKVYKVENKRFVRRPEWETVIKGNNIKLKELYEIQVDLLKNQSENNGYIFMLNFTQNPAFND